MPKVSVVIPAYNAMEYLPQSVESVLQQTFTDFEVLIVNDGSSDHVEQWVSRLANERVKLISQDNRGVSSARNAGISRARGEYVAFLDADDLWEPTKLAKQVDCLETHPEVGLIHTWMFFADGRGKSTGRVLHSAAEGWVWEKMLEKNLVACSSVMVRRSCFDAVGAFDPDLKTNEDWELWVRISSRYPFAVIKEPLVYYRQLPTSISKNCKVMEAAFHTVIEKIFESATPDLEPIKSRSYSHAYFCLAWKALQSSNRDFELAAFFQKKAIAYYSNFQFSKESIRLGLAITLMRCFGRNGYAKVLTMLYTFRRFLSPKIKPS